MVGVVSLIAVVDDSVVDDTTVSAESSEGFVQPAVVVLCYGGDTKGGSEVLESAEWCDECSKLLTFFV